MEVGIVTYTKSKETSLTSYSYASDNSDLQVYSQTYGLS